eukprot:TRINITY_DN33059_c0_g1_i1.p1 TRINITY_DN33059_c0_g1~~TRINITY_DN33059_c0_g1_i1.p1  ORF type:complete len:582 (+),score=116.17 TRINITY_DN33059_c0_g1_i1:95-1840(+)
MLPFLRGVGVSAVTATGAETVQPEVRESPQQHERSVKLAEWQKLIDESRRRGLDPAELFLACTPEKGPSECGRDDASAAAMGQSEPSTARGEGGGGLEAAFLGQLEWMRKLLFDLQKRMDEVQLKLDDYSSHSDAVVEERLESLQQHVEAQGQQMARLQAEDYLASLVTRVDERLSRYCDELYREQADTFQQLLEAQRKAVTDAQTKVLTPPLEIDGLASQTTLCVEDTARTSCHRGAGGSSSGVDGAGDQFQGQVRRLASIERCLGIHHGHESGVIASLEKRLGSLEDTLGHFKQQAWSHSHLGLQPPQSQARHPASPSPPTTRAGGTCSWNASASTAPATQAHQYAVSNGGACQQSPPTAAALPRPSVPSNQTNLVTRLSSDPHSSSAAASAVANMARRCVGQANAVQNGRTSIVRGASLVSLPTASPAPIPERSPSPQRFLSSPVSGLAASVSITRSQSARALSPLRPESAVMGLQMSPVAPLAAPEVLGSAVIRPVLAVSTAPRGEREGEHYLMTSRTSPLRSSREGRPLIPQRRSSHAMAPGPILSLSPAPPSTRGMSLDVHPQASPPLYHQGAGW